MITARRITLALIVVAVALVVILLAVTGHGGPAYDETH